MYGTCSQKHLKELAKQSYAVRVNNLSDTALKELLNLNCCDLLMCARDKYGICGRAWFLYDKYETYPRGFVLVATTAADCLRVPLSMNK